MFSSALSALSGLVLLGGFLLVTWQVAGHGRLARLDERAGRALTGRGPARLAELGADLGNMAVALPVLAAAVAYALWRGHWRRALCAVAAMALVPALVVPLKLLLDRQGPLSEATGYYPSGHTATALVAYGAAALLVHRRALVPVAVVLTLATGTGLVLRGYHWPLDVVGSVLLFTGVFLLAAASGGWWNRRGTPVR
ncbi:phosphatase PAP2 family protein [Streptomyces coeruleoprunus]|uniref:Phosphatase PAP2 family protein n=1 Tax=Streptomyces coeruleoprunus TaxID=285563 RepID=A0ABV9XGA2_9ACTN